jgi:transglutaminase-like putative cysteine protease
MRLGRLQSAPSRTDTRTASVPMILFKPLPRALTRPVAFLMLVAWTLTMAVVVNRSYLQASPANLATDLARYGSTAVWRGVYYRGEKIGFTVSQTTRTTNGFELQEDGRLQMLLLGQDTAATIHTTARVDAAFALRSFDFSLDPGTGPVLVKGTINLPLQTGGTFRLTLAITSGGETRTETRELAEAPVMALNLSRLLANGRLVPGSSHQWNVLDPATLQSASMTVRVGSRDVVRANDTMIPAFRVEMEFRGLKTTSWITDTGEIVREESTLGLMTVRESAERARGMAVPGGVQADLLRAAAVVPTMRGRIDEPRDVRRLRLQLDGADLPSGDLDGAGQRAVANVIEIVDPQSLKSSPREDDLARYLAAEPLLESDDPEIHAEAERAVRGAVDDRTRAERLTRYVNGLLDKKPTMSLPSAREVLRTKVGDCNEHTALYVAMARSIGMPSRIAVGLVFMHGAFYYHAWPEVYVAEGQGRGLWLPVDPTLNQFPADATHLRLARGGLDKQAAVLPLIGRLKMTVLDVELAPGANRILVGRQAEPADLGSLAIDVPRAASSGCQCSGSSQ